MLFMYGRRKISSIRAPIFPLLRRSFSALEDFNRRIQGEVFKLYGNTSSPATSDIKTPMQLMRVLEEKSERGFDSLSDPVRLFDRMVEIGPVARTADFNNLFTILARFKSYSTAIYLIRRMQVLGIPIDEFTLNLQLNCFCRLDRLHYGFAVIGGLLKRGYEPKEAAFVVLMNALIGENRIAEALELFNVLMRRRRSGDLREFKWITHATIMNALFKSGKVAKAVWVSNMTEDCSERLVYNTVINGLCMNGRVDTAMSYRTGRCFLPNVVSMNSLIQGYASLGRWADVEKTLKQMTQRRIEPNSYTFHVLMDASGNKKRNAVSRLYRKIAQDPNYSTKSLLCPDGSALVDSRYRQKGYPTESILEIMSDANAELFAYNSLMKRYCLDGRMDEAQHVFNYLVNKRGFHLNISSYNILINGYCNRLELDEAMQLYREIPQEGLRPNTETYHSLLKGLLVVGRCVEAGNLFRDMINSGKGESPGKLVLYSSLLNSLCSRDSIAEAGKVEKEDSSHLWYRWMKPDFCHEEIVNQAEKLLLGLLAEAEDLTNKDVMVTELYEAAWRSWNAYLENK